MVYIRTISKCNFFGKIIFLVLIFSTATIQSQNLVTNPSFEAGAWPDANSGSADWLTGPTNIFGTENAFLGTRYMGISMGRSPVGGPTDFKEYIKSPLTAPLIVGNVYDVSLMISLGDNYGDYACNRIGFVTTVANPFYAFSNAPIPLVPVWMDPVVRTNKIGWTQISGTFVATSPDNYIIIGNFQTMATATWSYVGPGASFYYGDYFMDQGCLGPAGSCNIPLPIELLSFSIKRDAGVPTLNWKTSCSLDCEKFIVERSKQGFEFEPIATVQAKKMVEENHEYDFTDAESKKPGIWYYRINEIDKNGKKNYSKMIALDFTPFAKPDIAVYPVPSVGDVTFEIEPVEQRGTFQIFDFTGKIIFEKQISNGPETINLNKLNAGTYFGLMRDENGQMKQKKFIITGSN